MKKQSLKIKNYINNYLIKKFHKNGIKNKIGCMNIKKKL